MNHVFDNGRSGRHNCLWCLIVSGDLKEPPANRTSCPLRSLASLRADHEGFLATGGNLEEAKDHNNVIMEYFFNIPLENV